MGRVAQPGLELSILLPYPLVMLKLGCATTLNSKFSFVSYTTLKTALKVYACVL